MFDEAASSMRDGVLVLKNLDFKSSRAISLAGITMAFIVSTTTFVHADDQTTVLDTIVVKIRRFWATLGSGSSADTGTTSLTGVQLRIRATDGGDANAILKDLPNIQYQNETNNNAGATDQSVIDTRPREVSISGGRVYENNFIIEGIETNNVTGTQERYGAEDLTDGTPNADRVYGLHSQTIFVPVEFVEKATVVDSNASAKYGNFQGGVVSYKLNEAKKDRWKTSFSFDYSTSDWTQYNLRTEDGLNPNKVERPAYIKRRSSISVSGPVNEWISVLGQYSTERAASSKDKDYQYGDSRVHQDSQKDFYRLQSKADTDLGLFTFEGMYSDYSQEWESNASRNFEMDVQNKGWSVKLQNDYDLEDFSLGGVSFNNVKLESKLSYAGSTTLNDANSNLARVYTQSEVSGGAAVWNSTELSEWCRTDPTKRTTSTNCSQGGWGDKEQGQKTFNWAEELTGDVGNGKFLLGANYSQTDASRRRPEDFIYYTSGVTVWDRRVRNVIRPFACNTTEACSSEQFANIKSIWRAFDLNVQVQEFNAYTELDQTWNWLNVRAGARFSYDNYQENINIAPRAVATVTPWDDLSISAGFNRYFNANSVAYAVRDKQPRGQTYTRQNQGSYTIENVWTRGTLTGNYTNRATDLETPYTDEFTLAFAGKEPLTGGNWRVRFMDRQAKDQYASENLGSNVYQLSNSGSGAYQSVVAEYSKDLDTLDVAGLDSASFNTSIAWSRQEISNNSYYEEDLLDDRILYRGQSYSLGGFGAVTGNMDIPLRLQAGFSTSWLEEALSVDISANYNFAFDGVVDTGRTTRINGVQHDIWEDHSFDPTLTFNLGADYRLSQTDTSNLTLNIKVNNVLNETGNVVAGTSNPWVIGRTVWAGVRGTF